LKYVNFPQKIVVQASSLLFAGLAKAYLGKLLSPRVGSQDSINKTSYYLFSVGLAQLGFYPHPQGLDQPRKACPHLFGFLVSAKAKNVL